MSWSSCILTTCYMECSSNLAWYGRCTVLSHDFPQRPPSQQITTPTLQPAMVWGKEAEGGCCADLWWQMLANVGNRCWLKSMLWHTKMIQNADVKPLEKPSRDSGWAELRKQLDLNDWQGLQRLIHFSRSTCLDGGSSVLAQISTHIS